MNHEENFFGVACCYGHDASLWEDMKAPEEIMRRCGFAHSGAIMQNVYLYSAAVGWNCVVRMSFDAANLAKLMKLSPTQIITLIHTVGKKP